MHTSDILLVLSAFLSVSLAAPTPAAVRAASVPTCDPSYNYNQVNGTLTNATLSQLDTISTQAQMTAASVHIIGYDGFADLIPGIVEPVTSSLNTQWTPQLASARIKCPVCKGANGGIQNPHPKQKPIIDYDVLYTVFSVATNMLSALDQKQCSVPGYTPPQKVKNVMRPLLNSLWAALGTGPTTGQKAGLTGVPTGAIYPYYDCLATYATSKNISNWEQPWFALNQLLVKINGTACVS